MTSEQLKHIQRVLHTESVPCPDTDTHIGSSEWRRANVHTKPEISLGSLTRKSPEYGPVR